MFGLVMNFMNQEDEFLNQLQLRAQETSQVAGKWEGSERWVKIIAQWLGVNPWRVLIPISIILAGVLMFVFRGQSVKLVSWLQGLY